MKNVQFVVEAKKYFEVDTDRLKEATEDDLCIVTIDFKNKKANYIWYNPNSHDNNPANHPSLEDDFESVVELWEQLGKPIE